MRWFCPCEPWQALLGRFGRLLLGVASPLAGLACPAKEASLLIISGSSTLVLVPPDMFSWFFEFVGLLLWCSNLDLVPVHSQVNRPWVCCTDTYEDVLCMNVDQHDVN